MTSACGFCGENLAGSGSGQACPRCGRLPRARALVPGPRIVIDDFAIEERARMEDTGPIPVVPVGRGASGYDLRRDDVALAAVRVRVRWGRVAALAVVTLVAGVGAWMALHDTAARLSPSQSTRAVPTAAPELPGLSVEPADAAELSAQSEGPVVTGAPIVEAPSRRVASSSSRRTRQPDSTATFNHFQGTGNVRGPSYPSWFGSRESCRRTNCSR